MARQTTFYNAKAVEVSTPTIKNASAIEASYGEGTMEHWKSQCPHCGQFHEIQWEDIHYEYEESIVNQRRVFKITKIWYTCPECAAISDEATMKRQPARWEADNPAAYADGVRSFWLNAFVSQWASWESIILKHLKATGNSRKMQVVYNTCFGLLWEDRGDLEDEGSMLSRREDYGTREDGSPVELPDGVLVLTCGVDTQNDRLEYEALDCRNYALAAFKALPANLEEIDRRLKIARGKAVPADNTAAQAEIQPAKRTGARKQGSALDRYYDDW